MTRLERLKTSSLYLLLTQAHCRMPILEAAAKALRGGVDIIQLREKEASDRQIETLARELHALAAEYNALFFINDRADIARLVEADGVHLGQEDIPVAAARKVLEPGQLIGLSTHAVEQASCAAAEGADYIGVGPMYPTATRGYEKGVGTEYLKAAAEATDVPLVAIGGITTERVPEILNAVPHRKVIIAVCSAILGAEDIEAEARTFREAIETARG